MNPYCKCGDPMTQAAVEASERLGFDYPRCTSCLRMIHYEKPSGKRAVPFAAVDRANCQHPVTYKNGYSSSGHSRVKCRNCGMTFQVGVTSTRRRKGSMPPPQYAEQAETT